VDRRGALRAIAAAGLAAALPLRAAPLERLVPASGERLPAIGLGTWLTFDVGGGPERRSRGDVLAAFFESGGRKVEAWYSSLRVTEVDFEDQAEAFRNINTLEELAELEQQRYR